MKYYLIGIKGSGMSALALILNDLGYSVVGYDDEDSYQFTEDKLKERNIKVYSDATKTNVVSILPLQPFFLARFTTTSISLMVVVIRAESAMISAFSLIAVSTMSSLSTSLPKSITLKP